jgi:hypothetical protein
MAVSASSRAWMGLHPIHRRVAQPNIKRMRVSLWLIVSTWLFSASAQVHVLTYHNDNARTGANVNEKLLTLANVNVNDFGKLFAYSVDGYIYAQPLYVSGLTIPGRGARNVVFVATEHNSVYALDADNNAGPSGGVLWQVNLGPSAATPTTDFGNRYGAFNAIVPEIGITSTPVIDLASGTIYVDAFTHEGTSYIHRVHALNLTNGTERPSSPVLVAASIAGTGVGSAGGVLRFDSRQHIQRSALTLAGGRLYVAFGGYADTDPYHGWIIGFDPTNLQQLPNYVFNTTPNSTVAAFGTNAGEGGIWMAGCGPSVDAAGSLYFACGNGSFNALNGSGGTEYGSSFIRLSTQSGLAVADYFTPYNQAFLADNDLDVGSGGVLLVPDQPGPFPRLMIGGTKVQRLYLMNRDMMTAGNNHYNNGGSSDAVLQTLALGGGIYATPAYFNGRIYCAAVNDVMAAFSFSSGVLSASPTSSQTFPYPGATPSVSANGTSNGILWALQNGTPGVLAAFNATNLASEIYNSTQAAGNRDRLTNGVKFIVPTIANGKVFAGGQYALSVFGLRATPYAIWKSAHFGANAGNPTIAGDTADPDSDRLANIWEYALGSDPNRADWDRRPMGSIVSNRFRLQFSRNLAATNLSFMVQRSPRVEGAWTTLLTYSASAGWTTNNPGGTVSESAAAGAPPDQYVAVSVSDTAPASRSFFRVLLNN